MAAILSVEKEASFGEHVLPVQLRVLVLLQQHRSDKSGHRGVDGEDADDPGAALFLRRRLRLDLLIHPLQQVGALNHAQVLLGEALRQRDSQHQGARADLLSRAQSALEVNGIQVNIGVAAALQRPAQEGMRLLVDVLADPTQLRLGDVALGAQISYQGVNLAGGYATDVGLYDHGVQGLVHPAAGFKDRGQEVLPARSLGNSMSRTPT